MSSDVLDRVKATSIYPDHLMGNIAKSVLPKTVLISLILHLALIGLTSIRFIGLCMEYDTMHPKEKIKAQLAVQRQAEAEAKRDARLEAARQAAPPDRKTPADTQGNGDGTTGETTTPEDGDGKTPIEQELEKVDTGRPEPPAATFDNVDDLL